MLSGEGSERHIGTHGCNWFTPVESHRQNGVFNLLIGIPESTVEPVPHLLAVMGNFSVGNRQFGELDKMLIQPFTVGLAGGIVTLNILVLQ